MAILPTVELIHLATGRRLIINATDYARDLGKYGREWKIVGQTHGDATDAEVRFTASQSDIELLRRQNPLSPASKDEQRAFEARRVVISTDVSNNDTNEVVIEQTDETSAAAEATEAAIEAAIDETVEKIAPVVSASRRGRQKRG